MGLLSGLVDRGLVDEVQLLAVLLANAVGAALPAGVVEDLVGLVDVEFKPGGLRAEARRIVEEVPGRDSRTAIDEFLDRSAVDQQVERVPHRLVRERRVLGLEAGALAVDLVPGVGGVELDVLDAAALHHLDVAFAAFLELL